MQNFIGIFIYPPHVTAAKFELWRGIPRKILAIALVPFITKQHGEIRKGAMFFKINRQKAKQKSRYVTTAQ